MRYIRGMGLNNGITVRLDPETRARLEQIADRSGVKSSMLMRRALSEYLDQVESDGSANFQLREPRAPYNQSQKQTKEKKD